MKTVVVYESMFGNTHVVADQIAAGLRPAGPVTVVPAAEATVEVLTGIDLLVVGGPTHVHGMTSERSRQAAKDQADKPGHERALDPDAEGQGLRDWFPTLDARHIPMGAAFDTRMHGPAVFTGRASKGIARRLHSHGVHLVAEPESFLVDKDNHLDPGEAARAAAWGAQLAEVASQRLTPH